MAYAMTKQGSLDNCITYEFICDALEDMNAIENRYRTIGSIAVVLQGESGGMEAYIAGSNKQWNNLGAMGTNGSSSGSAGGGLSIYICAQNEVSNGLPNIQDPDETTIYLVSAGNENGNLYEEYIYVNNAWEKFGAASIDLSNYATKSEIPDVSGLAPKASPVFTDSLSLGRKNNTTVGIKSAAIGSFVTASGSISHAEGEDTIASGDLSHAEGKLTIASDYSTHAEGVQTLASGFASHAEGEHTVASGRDSHVSGRYNIIDDLPEWSTYHQYNIGDKVKQTVGNYIYTYICTTAHNSGPSLQQDKWTTLYGSFNFAEIIGNGTEVLRSNARTLDWDGNERLMGNVYVGCNADSTGGNKVATETYVQNIINESMPTPISIPNPPQNAGIYILQVQVSNNGNATYSWIEYSNNNNNNNNNNNQSASEDAITTEDNEPITTENDESIEIDSLSE